MNFRLIVICLLLLAVPSILYARWSKNQIDIEGDAFGVVVFDHKDHFDYLGEMLCTNCHQEIFAMDLSENPDFTMEEMEQGQSCGACHNGEQAFAVENCSSCHPTPEVVFEVPDYEPAPFSHEVHTSMFGCSSCHPDLYLPGPGNEAVTMEDMAEGESCGACHDDSMAFSVEQNCDTCHQM